MLHRVQRSPQVMAGLDLAGAQREHQQHRQRRHPAAEHGDGIHGGLVGPVHVLEDEHGRRATPAELLDQLGGERSGCRRLAQRLRHRGGEGLGDVPEGGQRAGRGQVVAQPDQHPRVVPVLLGEPRHESRLADTGLPAHQCHRATTTRRAEQRPIQRRQRLRPFHQFAHPRSSAMGAGSPAAAPPRHVTTCPTDGTPPT
nr:hypothetical protein [Blastococcus sp. KM273129]